MLAAKGQSSAEELVGLFRDLAEIEIRGIF
jgi:hypothetical protein